MNLEHLRAFIWLRWRLKRNQLRKAGRANTVVLVILTIVGALASLGLFAGFLALGLFPLAHVPAIGLLYVWDGMVAACVFIWLGALVAELQRSEPLSLDRFLHFPVSLAGAFVINYLSSLFSLTLLLCVPAMLGLIVGLVISRGLQMLWLLPLLAAFLLMITAVTYQFQGWLASLMVNKRRRRTIVVMITMLVIVMAQLPNLANILHLWAHPGLAAHIEGTAILVSAVLPPGWLALGAFAAAAGGVGIPLLAIFGMTALATLSLWRAYRTTLRFYTGSFTAGKKEPAVVTTAPAAEQPATVGLMERRLPWVSEHVATVALGTWRALQRAPEVKMLLLTPIIMAIIFGSMMLGRRTPLPPLLRPLTAFGAISMVLLASLQLLGNQFGFDRNGFRVFVLCPAQRRDILLGKNLAFAAPILGLALILVAVVAAIYPMRIDLLLALLPQMISMYLVFCVLTNWLSILAPMRINPGSLKAARPSFVTVFTYLLFILATAPVLALTLLPLAAQFAAQELGWLPGLPICLLLSLLECGVIVLLYRLILPTQGDLLQERERKILTVVTTRDE